MPRKPKNDLAAWANAQPAFQGLARLRTGVEAPTYLHPLRKGIWLLGNLCAGPKEMGTGLECAKLNLGFPPFRIIRLLYLGRGEIWEAVRPIVFAHSINTPLPKKARHAPKT